MPTLHIFLNPDQSLDRAIVSGVTSTEDNFEELIDLRDAVGAFMNGHAKTMVVADEYELKVHSRG